MDNSFYKPEYKWYGRNLENYKKMHRDIAKSKGVEREFLNSKTLTQARKIAFGYKKRNTK